MTARLEQVVLDPADHPPLAEQSRFVILAQPVRELRDCAAAHAATLINFKVVHLSSTASGGGVAEMLRSLIPMYTELGVRSEWLVLTPPAALAAAFFVCTKTLHNLIHGEKASEAALDAPLYVRVSALGADAYLRTHGPALGDMLFVCHDPQTAGLGAALKAAE